MKPLVISYSLTGNNEDLAERLTQALGAARGRITEPKARTMGTTAFDILLNRTPKIELETPEPEEHAPVLFVGPVWMGHVASPFRGCFQELGARIGDYAYVSISGGADGPNPKLADELTKRLGKAPRAVIDLHIADLLPAEPKPRREDTSSYRLTEQDTGKLTERVLAELAATFSLKARNHSQWNG
jgi:hypothetical protein